MSPRSPRKRKYSRKAEGAKAPEATISDSVRTGIRMDRFLDELSRRLHPEQPLVPTKAVGELRSTVTPTPPGSAPYKARLGNILQGIQELNQTQRGFADYLNPDGPTNGPGAQPPVPNTLDDIISYIENELNLASMLYNQLRNKF